MEISERIKLVRQSQHISQKKLSRMLNVSDVTIRYWESGSRKPSADMIVALANAFNVSTDYLLGSQERTNSEESILSAGEIELLNNYRILDQFGKEAVDFICMIEKQRVTQNSTENESSEKPDRFIPFYDTPAAAGTAAPLDGVDFTMILVDNTIPYNADFAVRIQGNSMSPYINDGDTVYVKKNCDLQNGDVGIFCVDGATYCKQFYRDIEGNVTLVSANPDLSDTNIYISAESNSSFVCNGKVILDRKISFPDYFLGNNK